MRTVASETESSASPEQVAGRKRTGLVVCAWRDHQDRVGEWLAPPRSDALHLPFGRVLYPGDPKLPLWRWRPTGLQAARPVESPRLSAAQLLVEPRGPCLLVRRVGKRALLVRDQPVDEAILEPGDLVEVANELLFLVAEREEPGPWWGTGLPDPPFGLADEDGLVGESEAIWHLRRDLRAIASLDIHTLVLGPTGSGKELVARAVHRHSRRANGPFVGRNAATFPETLVDAELFGHAAGYPSPGMPERIGLVGAADRGVLLLDEIADLPTQVQPHLLRLLDEGEYHRLGDPRPRRVQLRLLGATHRPLESLRIDLRARFGLQLHVPGLTKRRDDVVLLARALLRGLIKQEPALARRFESFRGGGEPRLSYTFQRQLVLHDFTAHARELRTLLLHALLHSRGDELEAPTALLTGGAAVEPRSPLAGSGAVPTEPGLPSKAQVVQALEAANGVQEEAWRQLGLSSRHQLARLVKRYQISITRRPGG